MLTYGELLKLKHHFEPPNLVNTERKCLITPSALQFFLAEAICCVRPKLASTFGFTPHAFSFDKLFSRRSLLSSLPFRVFKMRMKIVFLILRGCRRGNLLFRMHTSAFVRETLCVD